MQLTIELTGITPMLQHNGRLANPIDSHTRRSGRGSLNDLRGMARRGKARLGKAVRGTVRLGGARHGEATAWRRRARQGMGNTSQESRHMT